MSDLTNLLSQKVSGNTESVGILSARNPEVQKKIDLFSPISADVDSKIVSIATSIVTLQTEIVSLSTNAYAVGCGTTAGATTIFPDSVKTQSYNLCTVGYDGDVPYTITTSTLNSGNIGIGTLLIYTQNDNSVTGIGTSFGSTSTCFRPAQGCTSGVCASFASSITSKQNEIITLRNQLSNLISISNQVKKERVDYEIERFGNNYTIRILNEENIRINSAITTIKNYSLVDTFESAYAALSANPSFTSGIYLIKPIGYSGNFPVYCDMITAGGGWMHVGTIVDNNDPRGEVFNTIQQSGGTHLWGAPFMSMQNTGIWEDSTTIGTQSFTNNFKSPAWVFCPFTQFMIKDQGNNLRTLLYTNSGQIIANNTSFSTFWSSLSWGADGSDMSNAAYAAGRVKGVSITNFGVNDPVLESSTKTVLLLKFGERDGVQDGNKDRTMIAAHSSTSAVNVDGPSGLGCFTYHDASQGGPVQRYRNIVPTSSGYPDEPPNTISGSPYQYTLWVR